MFFMIGITDGRKDFSLSQTILCRTCGKYGRYQVFMTYMSLLLFFIPCFRWNRHYYVQTTCCNTIYELDPEVGKQIARGEQITITEADLTQVYRGNGYNCNPGGLGRRRTCRYCGFETDEDFTYCPKCGRRLD